MSKLDRFSQWAVRRRVMIILAVIFFGGAFSFGAVKIRTDVILWHMFPYDHPFLQLNARFAEVFGGGGSMAALAVKAKSGDIFNKTTLSTIKEITNKIELRDEVYRQLTVSIASNSVKVSKSLGQGEIVIESLMFPDIPKNDEEMALLKKHIFSSPAYNGTLVSKDGTAALILTQFKDGISYEEAFSMLRGFVTKYTDDKTSIHVVGYPMLMGWIYSHKPQMYVVFGISLALMVLILVTIFRNFVGMLAPIAMVVICTGLGLGFIGWTGLNFSPLLYVLAFLVGARMLSNSVQITQRYLEEYAIHGDQSRSAYETMRTMLVPNVAAVATDTMGFLILSLAKIVLMQQLAIMMGFWMATIALSGFLVPIICSFLPIKKKVADKSALEKETWLDKVNMAMANFSMTGGRYVILVIVVGIVLIGGFQTTKLKVGDPTPGSPILWPDHPYNQDQAMINTHFNASSETFKLFFEGKVDAVFDPVVLHTFQKFARHMEQSLPDIFKSEDSIISMVRTLNQSLHDGDPAWFQLPREQTLLTGLLGYVRQAAGHATALRYVDGDAQRSQITLYFADHTSKNMLRIRDAAETFFETTPMKLDNGQFRMPGGAIGMEIAANEEMETAHAMMDLGVLGAILIMCSLAFRSIVAGLMLTLPLILSNLVAFGYMSTMNIGLTTNTLPCSAVGVGVGVDFAIYLYSRCTEEYGRCRDWYQTIMTAVRTAGKGIVFTGLTLILPILTWWFISDLKFQAQMGFFLAMLLFTNMIGALTLHPLLVMLIKPRFMTRGVETASSPNSTTSQLWHENHGAASQNLN